MKKYIKSTKYDPKWVSDNWMGPNPLWLAEELCSNLRLKPGMKVLDMGCGKGLTSVFLAKEYGVTVFANDLWISATENLKRFEEAGVADKVFPIHAEAHALPYAHGFFDVAVSIDSYHYYGASENYFVDVFSKLVKPGGQLGIVVPGLAREFDKGYPDTMEKYWKGASEMFTFHSKDWWRHLWEKTGICDITSCYDIDSPKEVWMPWAEWSRENFAALLKECDNLPHDEPEVDDVDFLNDDVNGDIALIVMTATKK
jgi:cyclopropane fatty-acyl-phospholipid synthase-like methyltransferase